MTSVKLEKKVDDGEKGKLTLVKNAADLQRLKLEKLMKNPEKPVVIPDRPKVKGMPHVPEFVRNVMGSSAGAGSGEFHVYRHLRRKEYARQKFIQERADRDSLDDQYHDKIEENKRKAEEETAKKRAKRLKKKNKKKSKKPKIDEKSDSESEEDSDNEGTSTVSTSDKPENDSVATVQSEIKSEESNSVSKSEPVSD